jgi:hypothetical protein
MSDSGTRALAGVAFTSAEKVLKASASFMPGSVGSLLVQFQSDHCRAEQVSVMAAAPGSDGRGSVVAVSYHGHDSLVDVRLDDGNLVRARVLGSSGVSTGDRVDVGLVG